MVPAVAIFAVTRDVCVCILRFISFRISVKTVMANF